MCFYSVSKRGINKYNFKYKMCKIKKPLVSGIDKVASVMPSPANKVGANAEELDEH